MISLEHALGSSPGRRGLLHPETEPPVLSRERILLGMAVGWGVPLNVRAHL